MKNKIKTAIILMLILLCSAGCAKSEENTVSTGESSGNAATDTEISVISTESSENSFRVKQLIPLTLDEEDIEFSERIIYSASYGSRFYLLASYQSEGSSQPSQWMYSFDMNTLGIEKNSFSLDIPEKENFFITAMYATGENELTLLLYGSLDDKASSTVLCKTDITGKPLNSETPFSNDTESFENLGLNSRIGNNKLYSIPDNSPIITEWEDTTNTTQIYHYDMEAGKKLPLATLSDEYVSSLCSNGHDTLYYINNNELKLLNVKTRTCEILCNFRDCGISLYNNHHLLINTKEELALCSLEGENPVIYLLTDEEETVTDSDTIRLVRLQTHGMEYVTRLAASYSTTSDYRIKVERAGDEQKQEALHNRTMMEIVSGQGPELMWVSEEDMRILAEKGALMDISELLSEDIKEQLLPGVLKAGTVDGSLVAITPEVSFYTMMTPDSVWSENSWTVSELMNLVESGDDWDWPLIFSILKPNYYTLFYGMLAHDMANSPYMDIENGISYFNGDEFIRTIEFCKKYGEANDSVTADWNELYPMLKNGASAAMRCNFYSGLTDFSYDMRRYENCHIVGFPRNEGTEGNGSYLYSEAYLVVNANATRIDAIKEFIACLLDYENQYSVTFTPVRKDVLQNSVVKDWNDRPAVLKSISPEIVQQLETKPDGTSYLDEFMAFAESCEPKPYCPKEISEILGSELPSYFTGDKTAEEVADIIHRRVQLYFDERD